ncbi:hypothetical protein L0Y59_01730 [Candidatus Uhrbacteria bacterium]|nr:hypothetical protein [Candidatus Uhrbacteria bacterium]
MRKRSHSLRLVGRALIVTIGLLPAFHPVATRASSPLVIGEVAWAGSSLSLADEWMELWNLGDADISLAGFSIAGASSEPIVLPEDAVIPAHGTYLVANYADDDPRSALAVAPHLVTTVVSLSNAALHVVLVGPDGIDIDVAGDGGVPPAGATGDVKASMIRDGTAWVTATTSVGFDAGSTDLGTPGICDGCAASVEEPPFPVDTPPADAVATTTDPIPPIDTYATSSLPDMPTTVTSDSASSTDDVVSAATSTSNGTASASIASVATSTVGDIAVVTPSVTSTAAISIPTASEGTAPSSADDPARYDLLHLNEIQANPDGEGEWIEITSLDLSVPVSLAGIQLHDAVGKVYTFASGTVDIATPFALAYLSSSRLNNGGDTVSLHDPSDAAIDTLIYEGTEKGSPWAREEDAVGAWRLTRLPTPGETNVIADPMEASGTAVENTTIPATTASAPTAPADLSSVSLPASPTVTPPSAASVKAGAKTTSGTSVGGAATPKTTPVKTASSKATVAKTTKTVPTKTTSKTTSAASAEPIPLTIDMTSNETYRGIRVTLQGAVGSPSGLLTGHGFVLLAPDGRGLLVRVPTAKKLPLLGSVVQVTGTLQFDDLDIPSLKLNAKDGWTVVMGTSFDVTAHPVDFLAPGKEDRWSLVAATGEVVRVQSTNVTMRVDGSDVIVAIRKVVDYRASRIAKGDTIRVLGLLDLSQDTPRVLPRTADDIEITGHAPATDGGTMKEALPGWAPFGAAGIAIAGTEGLKHFRERRKRKSLEKTLEACSHDLQETPPL